MRDLDAEPMANPPDRTASPGNETTRGPAPKGRKALIHALRSPLNAMTITLELLKESHAAHPPASRQEADRRARYVATLRAQVDRVSQFLSELEAEEGIVRPGGA